MGKPGAARRYVNVGEPDAGDAELLFPVWRLLEMDGAFCTAMLNAAAAEKSTRQRPRSRGR